MIMFVVQSAHTFPDVVFETVSAMSQNQDVELEHSDHGRRKDFFQGSHWRIFSKFL